MEAFKKKYFTKHSLILLLIFGVGVGLFAILTALNSRIEGSDDTVFQTQIMPYANVFEWIAYRYEFWSGRLFSEGLMYLFSPAPFILWQLGAIGIYGTFVFVLYKYYRLLVLPQSVKRDYLILAVIVSFPFLLDKAVLADGGLWVTGAMAYFWIGTIGLVSFYPIAHFLARGSLPSVAVTILGIVTAIIAASSQEQVGAVLVCLTIATIIYQLFITYRTSLFKPPWYLISFAVVFGLSFAVSLLAPGNDARIELEAQRWLPDFYETGGLEKLGYGFRWFIDAIINHSNWLIVLAACSMAGLFMKQKAKAMIDRLFIGLFLTAAVFMLAKDSILVHYWFEFYATWKPEVPNAYISLNLLPWSLLLIALAAAPLRLFRGQAIGWLISLLFLAAFASTAIITLSPTLYASGYRTLFIPGIILMVINLILIALAFKRLSLASLLIIPVFALATSHYIYQAARLLSN